MTSYCPSETFTILWDQIIEDLLVQACNNNINYCINSETADIHFEIEKKFEEYKQNAKKYMLGERLDRHKLAACICGAIIEVRPLAGLNGAAIIKRANEIIALYAGLNIIKFYMMYELLEQESEANKAYFIEYFKNKFDMEFPSIEENICDTKLYIENMENALFRSHHPCDITQKICYHFDIWAYSKIFYHLEIYNKQRLNTIYQNLKEQEN